MFTSSLSLYDIYGGLESLRYHFVCVILTVPSVDGDHPLSVHCVVVFTYVTHRRSQVRALVSTPYSVGVAHNVDDSHALLVCPTMWMIAMHYWCGPQCG